MSLAVIALLKYNFKIRNSAYLIVFNHRCISTEESREIHKYIGRDQPETVI